MATIDRIVCPWTGSWSGAPGYTTFYTSPAQGAALQPKVVTFWQTVASFLPTGFTVNVPTSGSTLDELTGAPVGNWAGGSPGVIPGTGVSSYSAVSGALIRWTTGVYMRGHHVVGKTFLVPISSAAYATGGVIGASTQAAIAGAAAALRSTPGQLVVWHRPKFDNSTPPIMLFSGVGVPVNGSSCNARVTYLRTRRD